MKKTLRRLLSFLRDSQSGLVTVITRAGSASLHRPVCNVTDPPATLLACMNRSSPSNEHFKRYGAVCVNILCGDHQEMSGAFANRALTMDERVAVT